MLFVLYFTLYRRVPNTNNKFGVKPIIPNMQWQKLKECLKLSKKGTFADTAITLSTHQGSFLKVMNEYRVAQLQPRTHLVTVDLYSAASRTRLWCATAFRKSVMISAIQSVQPGTSTKLQDHRYGLVYHAICQFTAQLSPGATHSSLPARGSGWVDLGVCQSGSAPRWFINPKTVIHPGTNRA